MTTETENPAAFPLPTIADQVGMSLRDYFAGQVLPASFECVNCSPKFEGRDNKQLFGDAAKMSYSIADAMLAARSQVSV